MKTRTLLFISCYCKHRFPATAIFGTTSEQTVLSGVERYKKYLEFTFLS